MQVANVTAIDVSKPKVMAGLLVGGMLPFVFSALAMNAVGRAAMSMIEEVRRQFKDIPELKAALEIMRKYDADISKANAKDALYLTKQTVKQIMKSVWKSPPKPLSKKW